MEDETCTNGGTGGAQDRGIMHQPRGTSTGKTVPTDVSALNEPASNGEEEGAL